jgi:hypothetical protein
MSRIILMKNEEIKLKLVNFYVHGDDWKKFTAYAKKIRVSRSQLIREYIREAITKGRKKKEE